MEFLLKLVDMIGGFDGLKKAFDGKKTYLSCAATILGGLFWICWTLYLFSQKQVDANTAYVQITVCAAAVMSALKGIFQRMATAKHDQLLKTVIEAQTAQTQSTAGAQASPASIQGGAKP
jgi:hypothetical protein